jgi:hypothetical protein
VRSDLGANNAVQHPELGRTLSRTAQDAAAPKNEHTPSEWLAAKMNLLMVIAKARGKGQAKELEVTNVHQELKQQ